MNKIQFLDIVGGRGFFAPPDTEEGEQPFAPTVIYGTTSENWDKRDTNFDIVVNKAEKYSAIEISFQETTNSTIERKAGQAKSRFEQIDGLGHKIIYIIDGVGNFKRRSALNTIHEYSHLLLAFSDSELNRLQNFIINFIEDENS